MYRIQADNDGKITVKWAGIWRVAFGVFTIGLYATRRQAIAAAIHWRTYPDDTEGSPIVVYGRRTGRPTLI